MQKTRKTVTWSVYRLTNTKTGRSYYGCTKAPEIRRMGHLRQLVNKVHFNQDMQREFENPHLMSFEVLREGFADKSEALEYEKGLARADLLCYNKNGVVKEHNSRREAINAELAEAIRRDYANEKITQAALGKRYGLSQGHISGILNKRIWSEAGGPDFTSKFTGRVSITSALRRQIMQLWIKHRSLPAVMENCTLTKQQIRAILSGRPEMPAERGRFSEELSEKNEPLFVDGEWYKNPSHARMAVGRSFKFIDWDENGVPCYTAKIIKRGARAGVKPLRPPVRVDGKLTNLKWIDAVKVYGKLHKIGKGSYLTEREYRIRELVKLYPKIKAVYEDPVLHSNGRRILWKLSAKKHEIPLPWVRKWSKLNEEDLAQVVARYNAKESKQTRDSVQAEVVST